MEIGLYWRHEWSKRERVSIYKVYLTSGLYERSLKTIIWNSKGFFEIRSKCPSWSRSRIHFISKCSKIFFKLKFEEFSILNYIPKIRFIGTWIWNEDPDFFPSWNSKLKNSSSFRSGRGQKRHHFPQCLEIFKKSYFCHCLIPYH